MEREKDEEFREMKRREKVLFGEDHVRLRFETEREEPSCISVPEVEILKKKVDRMNKNVTKRFDLVRFCAILFGLLFWVCKSI